MELYKIIILAEAEEHLEEYKKSGNETIKERFSRIFRELKQHPEIGIGKPKKLKHQYAGYWSRRINKKNKMIYEIRKTEITVYIISAKDHYEDH